ncbi:MAG: hypothetical protein ABJF04_18375 [Reichenbachiella sp.]|uniref:hypothetical protein n=1 Tax=Reichenbachiella sp. TaxID=2184521 RepID=UPI0032679223
MEPIFRIILFLAGVVNFIPSLLTFFPERISKSYGIILAGADLELLLRHRAIMFGIIGGLMIYSALKKKYYAMAVSVGLISMVSFLILYFLIGGVNQELGKVMQIDAGATLLLIIGFALFKIRQKPA